MIHIFLFVLVLALLYFSLLFYFTGFTKKGEPPLNRGYLPYFGLAFDLQNVGVLKVMKQNEKKYGKIFSLFFTGNRHTFITDSSQFQKIFKNTKDLTFYTISSEIEKIVHLIDPPKEEEEREFEYKSIVKYLQGTNLESFSKLYGIHALDKLMSIVKETPETNGYYELNLYELVKKCLYYGSTKAIFGDQFDADATEEDYFIFDEKIIMFTIGIPDFLLQPAVKARKNMLNYLNGMDSSKCCDFIRVSAPEKFKKGGKERVSAYLLQLLGASQTNSISGAYWTLFNVLNSNVKDKVIQEIGDSFDLEKYEKSVNSMKYLQASFLETSRLFSNGVSIRRTENPISFDVEGKKYHLPKGENVYLFQTDYFDESTFPSPYEFKPERYLGKTVDSFGGIPFGGGKHLCPGRFFAVNEFKILTILILKYFECELVEKKELNLGKTKFLFEEPDKSIRIRLKYKV
jgi:25/26-hydroxycholesterol 7alpha-hydroxylase